MHRTFGQLQNMDRNNNMLPPDTSAVLDSNGIKTVQKVVGSFLNYARAIDNTIITALNKIVAKQTNPTESTARKIKMLLDYLHTYPNAKIRFYRSDMILYVDSDAVYLVAEKAKSHIAGYYYCSNKTPPNTKPNPPLNGPIHIASEVQLVVMYDMGWNKRSSGHKYDSISGHGFLGMDFSWEVILVK